MSEQVHHLRLLRNALRAPNPDLAFAVRLLDEMLVRPTLPPPGTTPASERAYWQAYTAAIAAEAAPPPETPPDALDLAALSNFLSALPGEENVTVLEAKTVSRGFSKKTVLVKLAGARTLPEHIALRIDQQFNYLGTTVADEYPFLTRLWSHGARIPQPFALEPTGAVLGLPFLISAKVSGAAIGGNYVAPPRNPDLVADIAAALAVIHATPVDAPPTPHIDTEIAAYTADWRALNIASPIIEAGLAWIGAHRAAASGPLALVHNDFNFNNMLIEHGRLMAVVDWEFAHIGNPAADLGYFFHSAEATASFDFFLARYTAAGGAVPPRESLDFYIFWGQLRLAIMGFQVSSGFNAGKFPDIRFAATLAHLRSGMARVTAWLEKQAVLF